MPPQPGRVGDYALALCEEEKVLKLKAKPLLLMILMSWLMALPEYTFQVPANRIGSGTFTVTHLKIMQECITLVVFSVIAFWLFGEHPSWNIIVSYLFIVGAVYFAFRG